jgi:uncharacterized protein (DUF983 family)
MSNSRGVWHGKCPRCKQGDIFKFPLSRVTKFSIMNTNCPNCNAPFIPEPGFYFGSLFVSYAFNVAIMIAISLILYFLVDAPNWVYGLSLVIVSLLFIPFSFRYSRILFLYWFGGLQSK